MVRKSGSMLAAMAAVGALLFILFNWGPLAATDEAQSDSASSAVLSKPAVRDKAVAFAKEQLGVSGRPEAFVNYQTRSELSGYLQRENLQDRYDKAYGKRLPIDYYETEIKDASSGDVWIVSSSMTDGSVIGWRLAQRGSGGGASGDPGSERSARAWLASMGYGSADFRLMADGTPDSPWIFQSAKAELGDLRLQVSVLLNGDRPESFESGIPLPATYKIWMQRQKDWAGRMSNYSLFASLGLLIAAGIAAILLRKRVRFASGAALACVFTVIYCLNNLNIYPGLKAVAPDNARGWAAGSSVVIADIFALAFALAVYLSFAGGEALWGRLKSWTPLTRWRHPDFGRDVLLGMGRGYLLCLFLLGLQSFLYYTGDRYFHVWSTNDPSDSPYNLLWPILLPVMAWAAAISEEAVYRLFGIALFRRLRLGAVLSALIPSVIWALGHTAYPVFPVYTRLVEVTILGLFLSWAFLRYGFYTVLFAHASMDSIIMSLQLTSFGSTLYLAAAAFYILLPGLAAGLLFMLHRRSRNRPSPLPGR